MRGRFASSAWLEAADRLAAAFFGVFAAAAVAAKVAGAATWLAIALASAGVVGAILGLALKMLHERAKKAEERAALLARPPQRVGEAAAAGAYYEIGVDFEAREALDALGWADYEHAPYLVRDIDDPEAKERPALRVALAQASQLAEATLVVVAGPSKSGKSRTLLEAAAVVLPDSWLLVPKDPEALARLAETGPPEAVGADACVIWLDDLEPWVRPRAEGLNPRTLESFRRWSQPLLILATAEGKGVKLAGSEGEEFGEFAKDLLTRALLFRLDPYLSERERARLQSAAASRIGEEGIGEFLIAAPRLVARLESERDCPEGPAIILAAIDCQRAGLIRPLPVGWLKDLYTLYLPGPPAAEGFTDGLRWATRPLYATTALLTRREEDDEVKGEFFGPHDYIVEHAQRQGREIKPAVWDTVIDDYARGESDLLNVTLAAYFAGDKERAQRAARRSDKEGHGNGASNLGALLRERGELEEAEAAFRRADERGDGGGASNLGVLLYERGELEEAEAAYRRADERGHGGGASNLGVLLYERGELEEAEAAYRRADERGEGRA